MKALFLRDTSDVEQSNDRQHSRQWDSTISPRSPPRKGGTNLPPLAGILLSKPCDETERWIPYSARTPRRKRYHHQDRGAPSPVHAYCAEDRPMLTKLETTQMLFLPFLSRPDGRKSRKSTQSSAVVR